MAQPIVYEPNDYPDVEVLVDGSWHAGELTMWRQCDERDPAGWYAMVT